LNGPLIAEIGNSDERELAKLNKSYQVKIKEPDYFANLGGELTLN
jgi:hypothetical protein